MKDPKKAAVLHKGFVKEFDDYKVKFEVLQKQLEDQLAGS